MRFRSMLVVGSMVAAMGCSNEEEAAEPVVSEQSAVEESAADANAVAQALSVIDEVFDPDVAQAPERDLGPDLGRDVGPDRGRDLGRDSRPDLGRDVGPDLGRDGERIGRHARGLGDRAGATLRRCGKLDMVGPDLRVDFKDGCDLRDGMHVLGKITVKVLARDPGGPGEPGIDLSIAFVKVVVRGVSLDGGITIGDRDKDGRRSVRFDGLKRDDGVFDGSIGFEGKRDRRVLDGELDMRKHSLLKKLVFKKLVLESDHCYPNEGSIGFDGRKDSKGVIDFGKDSPSTGVGRVRDGAGPSRDMKMPAFGRCANPQPKGSP